MPLSLEAILSSERLPSLPEVAARVVEIARDPDPDFDRLVEAIRIDPAIAGRILKTANSALLGMKTRATSIEQAVPRLGTTMVRTLVLSFCIAEYQTKSLDLRRYYQHLWRDSLTQAAVAETLAERQVGKVDPANWFLAGLLQDIGRLALLHTLREQYVDHVLEADDQKTHREREQSWLGFNHVDVSIGLCRRWNLDTEIIEAISVHHASAHRVVPLRFVSSTSLPAALITAAHVSEYMGEVGHNLSCSREHIERLLMQVFALRPNEVFRVLADVDARVGELSATFGIDIGRSPELESILAEAQELLAEIALASQLRLVGAACPARRERPQQQPADRIGERDTQWRDELTGAFNRSWLNPALSSVIDQAHQYALPIGVIFIDLNRNSQIHEKGSREVDEAQLQMATKILRQCIRLTDSVVRYSGDEFAIILKDVNLDMLALLAEQLRLQLHTGLSVSNTDGPVTCSVGVVYYAPQSGAPIEADMLIREAYHCMQEAHRKGGNQTILSSLENGRWVAQPTTINVSV
ncbi:MAG: HDOD domain-containing protein [Planctomycetota bacterium]